MTTALVLYFNFKEEIQKLEDTINIQKDIYKEADENDEFENLNQLQAFIECLEEDLVLLKQGVPETTCNWYPSSRVEDLFADLFEDIDE